MLRSPHLYLLIGLMIALTVASAAAVELETIDAGDHTQIVVQNELLRMVVVPEYGGRITSLTDLRNGVDVVWSDGMDGGALDDRDDFTGTAFTPRAELARDGAEAHVWLTGEAHGGYKITKQLVVMDGKPLVEQRITVENGSQRPRAFWQRSFIRPGDKDITGDETFYLPTAEGVRATPNMNGWQDDFTEGWTGVIDAETGAGILFIIDLELVERFYYWRGSQEYPTVEWICKEVQPGQKLVSRSWIALTSDVQEYNSAVVEGFVGTAWWKEGGLQTDELADWVDLRPKVQPDANATARGFTLYRAWGENPGAELSQLRFDSPAGGADSMTLQIAGLAAVDASVSFRGPGADAYSFFVMSDDRNRLLPTESLALKANDVRQLQLVFEPQDAAPGELAAELVLGGNDGREQVIALSGNVWPVRLPDRALMSMKNYGGSVYMFSSGPDLNEQTIERMSFFLDDSTELGQSVCDVTLNPDQNITRTLVRGTDLTIGEALKQRPELFADRDNLPALDFSYFNPWIHGSLLHGHRFIETHAPPFARNTTLSLINLVAGEQLEPGSEEYFKVYRWYFGELLRWMREHGYPEAEAKVSDEISPDEVPHYIEVAAVAKQVGFRPYTTITGHVAGMPELLNAMDPVSDGWQTQWMSNQVFRDLIEQRYATVTKREDLSKAQWGPYGNGGAQATYATQPFEAMGVNAGDFSAWTLLVDGEPLEAIGGPWGNTRKGVVALSPPTLYISLPDGANPAEAGQEIVLEYTVREPDPNGEVLVDIDDTDVLTYYTGSGNSWKVPYVGPRGNGLFAASRGYRGHAWWAYAHGWHADSRVVFLEDGVASRTPCWWGLRDGNQDGDLYLIAEGMVERAAAVANTDAQRTMLDDARNTLAMLVSHEDGATIPLEEGNYRGRLYWRFPRENVEDRFRDGRQTLLALIANLSDSFGNVSFTPDLYWGDDLVLARDQRTDGMIDARGCAAAPHQAALASILNAARDLGPALPMRAEAAPQMRVVVYEGAPAAAELAALGIDAEEWAISEAYPRAGDFMLLRGEMDGRPCAAVIGADAEGALLGVRAFGKLLQPRW
jgi:hypothetical protein